MKRAFTLVEVVVVLAVVMILTALLFPVFQAAKSKAKQTSCLSDFRQAFLATTSYMSDYNDSFPVAGYRYPGQGTIEDDKTWVQLVLPYARDFRIFRCPADYTRGQVGNGTFDGDMVIGDVFKRYYNVSKLSNLGYNYLYLAPLATTGGSNMILSAQSYMVGAPSSTLLFVDSVANISANGAPQGGGNYLVVPPCRYADLAGSGSVDTFWGSITGMVNYYQANQGWLEDGTEASFYGGAWPWHDNRINIVNVDGSARSLSPEELRLGCSAGDNWTGTIYDTMKYAWDLN